MTRKPSQEPCAGGLSKNAEFTKLCPPSERRSPESVGFPGSPRRGGFLVLSCDGHGSADSGAGVCGQQPSFLPPLTGRAFAGECRLRDLDSQLGVNELRPSCVPDIFCVKLQVSRGKCWSAEVRMLGAFSFPQFLQGENNPHSVWMLQACLQQEEEVVFKRLARKQSCNLRCQVTILSRL